MSRKIVCKRCKAKCCTCQGCNPDNYVDNLCPKCQKDAANTNKRMSGLRESQESVETGRLQSSESSEK